MTNEQLLTIIISILIPLGGLILVQSRSLRRDMTQMEARLREDTSQLGSRMDRIESQIGELRERMAHLEGLLEGLREAITRRNVA